MPRPRQRSTVYQQAVIALQALLRAEGPEQVHRAYGDAIAHAGKTPAAEETSAEPVHPTRVKKATMFPVDTKTTIGAPVLMERPRLLLSQEEAADELGIGIRFFTAERDAGRIQVVDLGRRKLVPYAALVAYVRCLCEEQGVALDERTLSNWEQEPKQHTRGPSQHREW